MSRKIVAVWVSLAMLFGFVVIVIEIAPKVTAYTSHDPFRINSNAEFASMAVLEGWTGDGSAGNLYIIEGYDINGSGYGYCIYIGNTTVHFKINDSYLHEASGVGNFPYFYDSGIILFNVQNGTIANNIAFSNNNNGIFLYYSNNNTITNNNASNNWNGIFLQISDNNIIANNTASSNNDYGIYLYESSSNTIANNNASSTKWFGICLSDSSNNTIANNTASNNDDGIYLYESSSNTIVNNTASSNNDYGIFLYSSSSNNITNNKALNNDYGIFLYDANSNIIAYNTVSSNNGYGIWIEYSFSLDNKIYHNNIISNTNQASDDSINSNQWDNGYPLGGNYWSDYSGVDNFKGPNQDIPGSDGIGDTPYIIDADSQDYYPLMEPFTNRTFDNFTVLKQGWNLISIPLIQVERNITRVLGSIDSWYDAVQLYDSPDSNDLWKHHKVSKPYGNDLFELNETIGFWIHITQPGDTIFLYNGTQPTSNQTIPLHPGWNMVGYPPLTSYNRTVGLNNLTFDDQVDAIWSYDAATQKWEEMGESDNFEIGKGYYIHVKSECEWEVPL